MEARALISLCACLVAAQVEEEMQEEADMEQAEQVKEWGVWAPSTNSRAPAETPKRSPQCKRQAQRSPQGNPDCTRTTTLRPIQNQEPLTANAFKELGRP